MTVAKLKDPRTPGQRRHDGLLDALTRLIGSGSLPEVGGAAVALLVTMTADQLESADGYATTGHGQLIPVADALAASGQCVITTTALTASGGIESYGRDKRLPTPAMRKALLARDRGCTFPGCDAPPTWCQPHHFIPWDRGGPTSLDNLGLACDSHHRDYEALGWQSIMIDGVPHWIPPAWIDPRQIPVRNTAHDLPDYG